MDPFALPSLPFLFEALPSRFSAPSLVEGFTFFPGVCEEASNPLEPSFGFEDEYRRWCVRVLVDEAAATALQGRGTTGKGTVGARAARRTEDENIFSIKSPRAR
jgi:hypothetical protein